LEFNVPFQHKYGYIRDDNSTYVDVGYCCRPSSVVCRSVTLVSPICSLSYGLGRK